MATAATIAAKLTLDTRDYDAGIEKAGKQAESFERTLGSAGRTIRNTGAALTAGLTAPMVAFGVKSTMAAARVDELDIVVRVLGQNAGYAENDLMRYVGAVEDMGIEAAASREIISKFITAQLNAADASKIARIAQDQAVISGENSTETARRLTDALITGNAQMFRSMNMNLDLSDAYDDMAESLGKNVAELSEQEKVQARVNAVMEYGTTITGTYEAAMGDSFKQMGSFKRMLNEIFVEVGQSFTPALKDAVFAVTDWLERIKEMVSEGGSLQPVLERVGKAIQFVIWVIRDIVDMFLNLPPVIQSNILVLGVFLAVLGPILLVGGQITIWISTLIPALGTLSTSLAGVGISAHAALGPLGLVTAAIAAIVAIAVISNQKFDEWVESQKEVEQQLINMGKSYDDYTKQMEIAAEQKHLWINSDGDLVDSYGRVHEANFRLTEVQYNFIKSQIGMNEVVQSGITHFGDLSGVINDTEVAMQKALKAQETLEFAFKLQDHIVGYRDRMGELVDKSGEFKDGIEELTANPYRTEEEQQELINLRTEYNNNVSAIKSLEEEHDRASKAIILDLLAMVFAAQGWQEGSIDVYLALAHEWGILETEHFEMATSILKDADDMAKGYIGVEEAAESMLDTIRSGDGLNTKSTHTHIINTIATGAPGIDYDWGQNPQGGPTAFGGAVGAGQPLWVGERGPEPFIPAVNGRVLSNLQAKNALRDSVGGGEGGEKVEKHYHFNATYPYQSPISLMDDVRLKEAAGV